MHRRFFAFLFVVGLVAAACGSTERPAAPTTTAPNTTAATSTTATTAVAERWTVVALGDSFANLYGWPTQLAGMVSEELGVEVDVDGDVCFGGCSSLDRIRASAGLRDKLAAADVVVLQPQPGRVVAPLWRSYFDGDCGGADGFACFRDAESAFRTYVGELLDEVLALAQPGATVRAVRATGTWAIESFNPGLRDTDPQAFDRFLENMLILSDHIADAAAERCIAVVDVNAIMSGPSYRDPVNPVFSNDGRHPSPEGSRVIAASIYALGFDSTPVDC